MLLYSMFVLVCARIVRIWISMNQISFFRPSFVLSPFFSSSIFISTTIRKLWRHWKSVSDAAKICFRAKGRRSLWAISEIMHHSLHRKVASGLTREKTGENWIYSLFEAALFTCILTPVPPSMLATVICKLRLDLHLFDLLALLHFSFCKLWCFDLICR